MAAPANLSAATSAADWLLQAGQSLAAVTSNPQQEALWLLSEATGLTATAARTASLHPAQAQKLRGWLQRRLAGEPFAYVVGNQPFRRLLLSVSPDVLIPREDTGVLVEWAMAVVPLGAAVWDVCTGSGCVALALKDERPDLALWASDVSRSALAVAQTNAQRLGIAVQWGISDWLDWQTADAPPKVEVIVSNPPYLASDDPHLPSLAAEPRLALVSGDTGLEAYAALIQQAPKHLRNGGWFLLEHGEQQAADVRALLQQQGFTAIQTRRDWSQRDRCSGGQWRTS